MLLSQLKDKIVASQKKVFEGFWDRLNVSALYIDMVRGELRKEDVAKAIDLRAQLMQNPLGVREQMGLQAQFGTTLEQVGDSVEEKLKADTNYLAVKKHLNKATNDISTAITAHNFLVTEWCNKTKQPWYKIMSFGFKKELAKPLFLG